MSDIARVLIVDDEADSREFLAAFVSALGHAPTAVADGAAALAALASDVAFDGVLLDVLMDGMDGIETLRRYRAQGGTTPVILMSALGRAATIVEALRLEAADFVTKPWNAEELREILERVISGRRATTATRPTHAPPEQERSGGDCALGTSTAMQRITELIERVADSDVPVLITGESGVGKDVVAHRLHARGPRKGRVFIKLNCAALPSELLESELYGHERGSFTGANRTKAGQFELADGGTLFLDEIGEMPPALQAKLLQVLQDGEFYRVGGERKIKVDVRVLVATNRDLAKAIASGTFRDDLYYRLNVVHLHIPPLRERVSDILPLLDHFIAKYERRYGGTCALPPVLTERFLAYAWPGNIRELENLVRRLLVLRDPAFILSELETRTRERAAAAAPPTPPTAAPPTIIELTERALSEPDACYYTADLKAIAREAAAAAEREAIVHMLARTIGNKREAADRLGISYKAILYKIRDYGIGRPRGQRRACTAQPS
jgi:two-component system response regulator AtoC